MSEWNYESPIFRASRVARALGNCLFSDRWCRVGLPSGMRIANFEGATVVTLPAVDRESKRRSRCTVSTPKYENSLLLHKRALSLWFIDWLIPVYMTRLVRLDWRSTAIVLTHGWRFEGVRRASSCPVIGQTAINGWSEQQLELKVGCHKTRKLKIITPKHNY